MADNAAPTSGVGVKTTAVESSWGANDGMSLTMDDRGGADLSAEHQGTQSIDVGTAHKAGGDTKPEPQDDQQLQTEETGEEQQQEEKPEGEEPAGELPAEYDPANAETVKAYEKAFTKDDGKALNLDALSQQWWGSVKDGNIDGGTLTDGTYKFLENKFGLSQTEVKEIEAGQVAQRKAERGQLFTLAGGFDKYEAAVKWGASGGYNEAQRKAFNEAINGRDRAKAAEAVELLVARFGKASGTGVSPKKNTTANATPGGNGKANPDVFRNRDEWQAAIKAAGSDVKQRQAVSDKFRRSPGAKNW